MVRAVRVKSHWFKGGDTRDPAQVATAAAAIVWRTGDARVKSLRSARFEIAAGADYVNALVELLCLMIVVADRIVYRHDQGEWRERFVSALTTRVGELLEDSFNDLLGPLPDRSYRQRFIDRLNLRAAEYADFAYRDDGPEFAFLRHFGLQVAESMSDPDDQRWALDQAMTVEGPSCVEVIEKAMRGLLGLEPKPARKREAGE